MEVGYFTFKYFRRGGRKKRNLLNFFCACFFPFQTETLQFMDWIFTFLLLLSMNILTENKCLCPCLFSHLLHCWLNRKCNLDICRCSYFEPVSTLLCTVLNILKVFSMCGISKRISKIYCWYFPIRTVRIDSLEINFRPFHPNKLFKTEGTDFFDFYLTVTNTNIKNK